VLAVLPAHPLKMATKLAIIAKRTSLTSKPCSSKYYAAGRHGSIPVMLQRGPVYTLLHLLGSRCVRLITSYVSGQMSGMFSELAGF
jgi:hypothetical protein